MAHGKAFSQEDDSGQRRIPHPYITVHTLANSQQHFALLHRVYDVDHLSSLKVNSPLRGGGSGSGVCGLLGVDEIVDGGDLDLFSWARRAEREDEDGFVGERIAARAFAEHLRLNKTYAMHEGRKSISKSVSVLVSKARQYVLLKQPGDLRRPRCFLHSHCIEESRTGGAEQRQITAMCRLRIRLGHVTFSGAYPSASATPFACAKPSALLFGGTFAVDGRVVCM